MRFFLQATAERRTSSCAARRSWPPSLCVSLPPPDQRTVRVLTPLARSHTPSQPAWTAGSTAPGTPPQEPDKRDRLLSLVRKSDGVMIPSALEYGV